MLYASVHIDPNLDLSYFCGYAHETCGPSAPGSTVNLPLPPGTTTSTYLYAVDSLLRVTRAFQPAALVVSLGYPRALEPHSPAPAHLEGKTWDRWKFH